MSKSGLFAHFDSKEDLQLHVLETARQRFLDTVVAPALAEPRGEPRVRALFENWLMWEEGRITRGGCPFVTASYEFDDRPGKLRESIVEVQRGWLDILVKATALATDEGHFRSDLDPHQFAYEVYSIFLGFHLYHRLLRDRSAGRHAAEAFEKLLDSSR